jgi:predicted secreted protein
MQTFYKKDVREEQYLGFEDERLALCLSSIPSSGYRWEIASLSLGIELIADSLQTDDKVFLEAGVSQEDLEIERQAREADPQSPEYGLCGQEYNTIFLFEVQASVQTGQIRLVERRSWESSDTDEHIEFSFHRKS